jgi:phytoene dehydrogenase-like protein
LVCAAYLAQGGQRVLVLEAADAPGGLAANREFHPGFRASVAHSVSHFSQKVANDLKLSSLGYSSTSNLLPTIGLGANQDHVVLQQDSVSGTSAGDADNYREYTRLMRCFADALRPSWLKTMPRIGSMGMSDLLTFGRMGLNIRMLGKKDMREFLRIASLPARDLMDEFFDNDILKATLSWDGLIGSKLAPRSRCCIAWPGKPRAATLFRRVALIAWSRLCACRPPTRVSRSEALPRSTVY